MVERLTCGVMAVTIVYYPGESPPAQKLVFILIVATQKF